MTCQACRNGLDAGIDFTMAFQPIVDVNARRVWAYEALVRGRNGEGAGWVLDQVTDENRYAFDQSCRVKAIELAARLFPTEDRPILSINFLPNAVYSPAACLRATTEAADRTGFPIDRIMLEFTESERIENVDHVKSIIHEYQKRRLLTAVDDFGAGFSGLNLLADFRTEVIKLDMGLIRDVDSDLGRRAIIHGILATARLLDVTVVAEGVETDAEMATLCTLGIARMQGFRFARPAIETLPEIDWPSATALRAAS